MSAIATQYLTIKFGAFTAVDRVSLSVEEGEIFGLVLASVGIAIASVALAQALDRRHRRRLEIER